MNKFQIILGASILLVSGQVGAAILTYLPQSQEVSVGDIMAIDIYISDPSLGDTIFVSGFDIGTQFNANVLSDLTEIQPAANVFSGNLGIPGTDSTAIWGVFEQDALDIVVTKEFSALSGTSLLSLQSNNFKLATLFFQAINAGVSTIQIANAMIIGSAIDIEAVGSATINVVPTPPAIWLFGTGLLGLIGFTKRRKAA